MDNFSSFLKDEQYEDFDKYLREKNEKWKQGIRIVYLNEIFRRVGLFQFSTLERLIDKIIF